jgi:hypothetical protein
MCASRSQCLSPYVPCNTLLLRSLTSFGRKKQVHPFPWFHQSSRNPFIIECRIGYIANSLGNHFPIKEHDRLNLARRNCSPNSRPASITKTGQVFIAIHEHFYKQGDLVAVSSQRQKGSTTQFSKGTKRVAVRSIHEINKLASQLEWGTLKAGILARGC